MARTRERKHPASGCVRYVDLPEDLSARLAQFCRATGDRPNDVIVDAIALHLDELDIGEEAERGRTEAAP